MPKKSLETLKAELEAKRQRADKANAASAEAERKLRKASFSPDEDRQHRNHLRFLIASATMNYAATHAEFKKELRVAIEAAKASDRQDQALDYDDLLEAWDTPTMGGMISQRVLSKKAP